MLKQDHYALLGVPREVDTEAIERACAGALSVTSDSAERARVRHARDTLCSPARRAAYDRSLRTIPAPPRGISGASNPPTKPDDVSSKSRWLWLGGMASLVLLAGGFSYVFLFSKPKSATAALADSTVSAPVKASPANSKSSGNGGTAVRQPVATGNHASIDPAAAYANAAPSVLLIESLNSSGAVANRASAVVIGHELVVTNCHSVQYAAAIRVRSGSNEYTAITETSDSPLDLCSLRVPGLTAPAALRGSLKQLHVGQPVFAIGASQSQERTTTQGQVSALRETADATLIQTSANITPGSSGGGLFDAEGRLIGIATHQHKLGPNQNLAMPVDLLSNLRNR